MPDLDRQPEAAGSAEEPVASPEPTTTVDLEDYKWASFIHAQGHDEAGSDYELCDGDCSYWPDAHDPNEDQPYDPSGEFYDPDA